MNACPRLKRRWRRPSAVRRADTVSSPHLTCEAQSAGSQCPKPPATGLARLDQDIANVATESKNWRRKPAAWATSPHLPGRWRLRSTASRNSEAAAQAGEASHVAARARGWKRRGPAQRGRQAGAAARDRSAHDFQTRQRETKNLWPPIMTASPSPRFDESARRSPRRRSRCPVDPSGADALGPMPAHRGDPALPEGSSRLRRMSKHLPSWRRLAQIGASSPRSARGAGIAAEDAQRAGVAGRRRLALGWLRRRRPPAPTGAARRLASAARLVDIEMSLSRPASMPPPSVRRWNSPKRAEGRIISGSCRAGCVARRAARGRCRRANASQYRTRDQSPRARKSALTEAHSRLNADRLEAQGAHESAIARAGRIAAEPRH